MNWKGVSYAPYFAGWFLTWPIVGYMGAQGFTGMVVFLALPVLLFVRPKSVPLYALAFLAFLFWIVAVSFWSPGGKPFLAGSLGAGTFTMDMVGARVVLTALACVAMLLAVRHVREESAPGSIGLIRTVGLIQGGGVIVTALLMQPIITLIIATGQSDHSNMTQNLLRNANSFLLLLPLLLAWLWQTRSKVLAGLVLAASFVAFVLTGTQTAMFGSVFMLAAMGLVRVLPRNGFRALFGGLAAYVLFAPVVLAWGLAQLRMFGVPLPGSFMSRSYSWQLVGQKIGEKPLFGHGLESAQTWADTYGDHPEWLAEMVATNGLDSQWEQAWGVYKVIPTHPHNMALQIWAETGLVGAVLVALALLLFGWRLRPPGEWSPISRYGAAGLVGAALAMFSFSYSMWNEAFWASVAVAAAVILLQARQDGEA